MSSRYEQAWREAVAHYKAGVKDSLLAEYRCRKKGCLLLHVWQSPNGPEFFAPAAEISDQYTTAGQLDWPAFNRFGPDKTGDRAGRLDDPVIARQWLWLMCDHLVGPIWTSDLRRDVEGRAPGKPVRINLPRDTPGQPHPREGL